MEENNNIEAPVKEESLSTATQEKVDVNKLSLQDQIKFAGEQEKKVAEANPEVTGETTEHTEIEKEAMAMGWKPDHNGKSFVSAEEFVRRAPLFRRIEDQSKQIRELRDTFKQTAEHLASVRKIAYEKALSDLKTKRDNSVETGDVNEFRTTEIQINKVQQDLNNDPIVNAPKLQEPEVIDPKVESFGQRNSDWYNENTKENAKMTAAAMAMDNYLVNQARIDQGLTKDQIPQIDVEKHLAEIESTVKRQFAHRFETKKSLTPSVGRSTSSQGESKASLTSKLSPSQRQLGEQIIRMTPGFTLEEYARQLSDMGRLK